MLQCAKNWEQLAISTFLAWLIFLVGIFSSLLVSAFPCLYVWDVFSLNSIWLDFVFNLVLQSFFLEFSPFYCFWSLTSWGKYSYIHLSLQFLLFVPHDICVDFLVCWSFIYFLTFCYYSHSFLPSTNSEIILSIAVFSVVNQEILTNIFNVTKSKMNHNFYPYFSQHNILGIFFSWIILFIIYVLLLSGILVLF